MHRFWCLKSLGPARLRLVCCTEQGPTQPRPGREGRADVWAESGVGRESGSSAAVCGLCLCHGHMLRFLTAGEGVSAAPACQPLSLLGSAVAPSL